MSNLNDKGIEHVIVLMLENRGFDHVMGWLYDKDNEAQINHLPTQRKPDFNGLGTMTDAELLALSNQHPIDLYEKIPVAEGAEAPNIPQFNPGEDFPHIYAQMWGRSNNQANWGDRQARQAEIAEVQGMTGGNNPPAPMDGYAIDFGKVMAHDNATEATIKEKAQQIMQTYVPEQLPVLNGLARAFAVSDSWYCSVPSQTNTNRAFSMAGTSRGLVSNNFYDAFLKERNLSVQLFLGKPVDGKEHSGSHSDMLPYNTKNLFGTLSAHNVDWELYWQDEWPPTDMTMGTQYQYVRTMFPALKGESYDKNFIKFDGSDASNPLFQNIRNGTLKPVTWIEPAWGGGSQWDSVKRQVGNDMHPVCDTTVAEDFVADLFNAVQSSDVWDKTLLVVTFDENGGTYDHQYPPPATPSYLDRAPDDDGGLHMDEETRTEYGFGFNQFGIRVPTLFISPKIDQNTIIRSDTDVPFDHTSLIATILDWQGIPKDAWQMGARVANAPTFDHVVTRSTPRVEDDTKNSLNVATTIIGAKPAGKTINYGDHFYLRYIGSKWPAPPEEQRYLGPAEWYMFYRKWYPAMTQDTSLAIKLSFYAAGKTGDPVKNMDILQLSSTETQLGTSTSIGAFHDASCLYYVDPTVESSGKDWQARILSSRSPNDEICYGDEIFLISQLEPNLIQDAYRRFTPDPLQRMAPDLDETSSNFGYMTSIPGIWGIWKLVKSMPETDEG